LWLFSNDRIAGTLVSGAAIMRNDALDSTGKVAMVTGAVCRMGFATARDFATAALPSR
jgi:hypothetical protein